jgi:hypothetical protein
MTRIGSIMKLAVVMLMCLSMAGAKAQAQEQQGGEPPKPPAKTYGPLGVDDQEAQNPPPDQLQPDNRPLTGFQQPTVGTSMDRHSYWVPGLSYYNFIQSNGQVNGGESGWSSTSYLNGNVSLVQNWSRSQLMANFSGGGYFSTDSTVGNGWFSQLSMSQTFNWERVQIVFLDDYSYLPEAQFGFGAGTGLSSPGVGGTLGGVVSGIGTGYTPGQTIFTAEGPRYFNTAGVQITYQLTRRGSVTVGGVYSLLRFVDPGNVENDNYIGNVGYNYQITRNNTIGLQYRYSAFHYLSNPQAIGDHNFQIVFGRRITGRLALQLSGGPEVTHFRVVQPPATKTQYVAGSGGASLTYTVPRGTISASYFHGVTGGSGVFLGATTDTFSGAITRRISRVWTGDLHGGYARNRSAESELGISGTKYDTFFVGASAARPLGHNAQVSLGYTAYAERVTNSACGGSNCSDTLTTHQITLGVSWHTRPFVLR